MNVGIYGIKNTVTQKWYVGSSKNIPSRWRTHQTRLRNKCHHSKKLQASWNKHGQECWQWVILESLQDSVTPEDLVAHENKWILALNSFTNGYNMTHTATAFSDALKHKLSAIFSGEGNPMYGRVFSEEHRRKIAVGNTGKKHTEEWKEGMSNRMRDTQAGSGNRFYGHTHSRETKEKMSAANKLRPSDICKQAQEHRKGVSIESYMSAESVARIKAGVAESNRERGRKRNSYWGA